MVMGAIAYNTRLSVVLIRSTMTAQQYAHDILQPHVLPLMQRLPGAIFKQNARPHTARMSQDCLRTVSALLLPILGLPDPQICLQSSISGIIWDGEQGTPQVGTNKRQGYNKYGTKYLKISNRTCMPQCPIVSYRAFTLERVQQGIKSSVLLPFSLQ
ncbi:uncharacterized protein TNCV_4460841 [Trichonephila clavipes]|nr:uncharacterized protein TNCV_4460841 [Trichonephila clavipes]